MKIVIIIMVCAIALIGWTFARDYRKALLEELEITNRLLKEVYCLKIGITFLTNIPANRGSTANPMVFKKGGSIPFWIAGIKGDVQWGSDTDVYFDGKGLVIKPQNNQFPLTQQFHERDPKDNPPHPSKKGMSDFYRK